MSKQAEYLTSLCERLRGQYRVPIKDGGGPLNGQDVFVRDFQTPPIEHHAADVIESLRLALADAIRRPMGVIPESADGVLTDDELMAAEARRVNKNATVETASADGEFR